MAYERAARPIRTKLDWDRATAAGAVFEFHAARGDYDGTVGWAHSPTHGRCWKEFLEGGEAPASTPGVQKFADGRYRLRAFYPLR